MTAYPPAPWRLAGRVAVVVSPRTRAMLLLALYGKGSTLRYGEVAEMIGSVVRCIYEDDDRSAMRRRPVRIELEVPERSPFASLDLAGRRAGLAGRLDVLATGPAARRIRREPRG